MMKWTSTTGSQEFHKRIETFSKPAEVFKKIKWIHIDLP
jgi:hypothetical protein